MAAGAQRQTRLALSYCLPLAACLGCTACDAQSPTPSPVATASCTAPSGVPASPANIGELIGLANALLDANAEPLTLPCLIASLERPLGVLAANSTSSLQPASGPQNPRIFLFTGNLVVTVGSGKGHDLLEVGEPTSETRSIKAELGFPLDAALGRTALYERIAASPGTVCAACHGDEQRVDEAVADGAYESDILRPLPSQEIALSFVQSEARACEPALEPERCALLSAIFDHGDVAPMRLSDQAKTFGQ